HQNGWRSTLRIEGTRAILEQETLVPVPVPPQVAESSLANMLVIGRKLTGQRLSPHEVWFRHAQPSDTREHARIFACTLRFGAPSDALIFDASWLELPLLNANRALADTLDRHAQELLQKIAKTDSLADRVRKQLSVLLPDGNVSIQRVARALAMSSRTLQRRLLDEGTSLSKLTEELRIELSLRYLAEPTLGIEDVALMLGFSDSRAFRRAFKRWQGVPPAEHRARTRASE
ncbi:MAG TPA: AraC family transcriptional regulator ligand-binding domain-containing protein, partial [Polyangiales bacterium]|nr:AraC family transcriptional regulator ligand-binding domain-containing protein [Polyangiales bacterium]